MLRSLVGSEMCIRDRSCGDGETKKALLRNQTTSSFLFFVASTFAIPPGDNYLIRTAVISACRLASISLASLGLAIVTAFLLSTTSLVGSPFASSTPSAFLVGIRERYYSASSSSICTKQKDRLTVIPLFSPGSSISIFFTVSARVVNHITAVQMISA